MDAGHVECVSIYNASTLININKQKEESLKNHAKKWKLFILKPISKLTRRYSQIKFIAWLRISI